MSQTKKILDTLTEIHRRVCMPNVRMFTSIQAADYIGVSIKVMRRGVGPREGPKEPLPIRCKWIGRKKLYDRKDLDAYLDSL